MRNAAAAALSSATFMVLTAAPALAGRKDWDGQDRGEAMSLGQAILLFGVLPLAISGGIALIVLIPDWARRAKASTRGGYLDDPTLADRQSVSGADRAAIGN